MEVMLIIFEGPDGAGKSTIAAIIASFLKVPIINNSYKDPCDYDWFKHQLEKHSTIIDRTFISEIVYSKVKGRVSNLTPGGIASLQDICVQRNHLIVYCTGSPELIIERAFSRGEDYVNEKELIEVIDGYEFYFEHVAKPRGLNFIKVNSFMNPDFIDTITANLRREELGYVKCINPNNDYNITLGKVYKLIDKTITKYTIINDVGDTISLIKSKFIELENYKPKGYNNEN